MERIDVENFIDELAVYLTTTYGSSMLGKIVLEIQEKIDQNTDLLSKKKPTLEVYDKFVKVVGLFSQLPSAPVVLILKNENEKYDMYIFRNDVQISLKEVASSEIFMDKIRTNPRDGMVIGDVELKEIQDFLKAYYIFRQDPKLVKNAQNRVYDYNSFCLEMSSMADKFMGYADEELLRVKNTIIYADEVLPYSLEYLDNYKKKNYKISFGEILNEVREDKYLGTSLMKVESRWH